MRKAIDLCFKGKQCKYNAITKFGNKHYLIWLKVSEVSNKLLTRSVFFRGTYRKQKN